MITSNCIYLCIATLFVELWKRRQSILVWEWDLEMDDQEEQPRPEFEVGISIRKVCWHPFSLSQAEVKTRRINPVTKFPEPYLPGWSKFGRVVLTNSFVLFLVKCLSCSL